METPPAAARYLELQEENVDSFALANCCPAVGSFLGMHRPILQQLQYSHLK